jgi:hypothetical protein
VRSPLVFAFLLLTACGGTATQAPQPQVDHDLHPFLWQVDGPTGPSYLLGTYHIGVATDEAFPPSTWDKLQTCDAVIFEMDTKSLDAFGVGMQPEGKKLSDELTQDQWAAVLDTLKIEPEDAGDLEGIKLWLLYSSILHELVDETKPIDTDVEERARAAGTRVVFLENVKEQEKLLERHQTADKLMALIGDLDAARAAMAEEMVVYKAGDEDRFVELTLGAEEYGDAFLEEVVYDRNEAWIPALEAEMKTGCMFLVVGASHLVGDRSVVDLLRAKGYSVTRIRG